MTLEELDDGLRKLGLNLDSNAGRKVRDMIVSDFGSFTIKSSKLTCSNCSIRKSIGEKGCKSCDMNISDSDPLKVGMDVLSVKNDIDLVPFIAQFVIPVYERVSGQKNTLEKLNEYFKRRWMKEHPEDNLNY